MRILVCKRVFLATSLCRLFTWQTYDEASCAVLAKEPMITSTKVCRRSIHGMRGLPSVS